MLLISLFIAKSASADETHKFSNGVSFSYPSGYQKQEANQAPVSTVSFVSASDPAVTLMVSLIEGGAAGNNTIPDTIDESVYKSSLPEGSELIAYKKITVGGKDALLIEVSTEQQGMHIFSRSVSIASGQDMLSVVGTSMDKNKIDAVRKTAESIEASIKF
jgi:hypothetical protein